MKMLIAAVLLAGLLSSAQAQDAGGKPPENKPAPGISGQMPDEMKQELTDKFIEERKLELDKMLNARVGEIEKEYSGMQTFQTKMKDDRVAFEKQASAERKMFLDSLKGMKPELRRNSFQSFNMQQKEKRRMFTEGQRSKRREFFENLKTERLEVRQELRQDIRGDRQEFKQEMRNQRQEIRQEMLQKRMEMRPNPPAPEQQKGGGK